MLVIGDVMLDVIAVPRAPIELGADTPAQITLQPGGSGANQAAWLAYLGVPVVLAARAGSDDYERHLAALRGHGVTPALGCDDGLRTGVLVSLISSAGERSFLTDRGANAALSRADLPDALLAGIGLVHVSAYALWDASSRAAVLDFLGVAAQRGLPITVDPGSVTLLREAGPAEFLNWTQPARICFPNAAEAAVLAGTPDLPRALDMLASRYEIVVIKAGAAGALASGRFGAQRCAVDAPRVVPLDTTGAGDAFVAAFLCAYLGGAGLEDCVQRGVAAGSQAVLRLGGRPPVRSVTPGGGAGRGG